MAERLNLREFQSQLADKLKDAANRGEEATRLGFVAGGRHWLTALDQVGEVVTVARLARAPWTRPWFLGVAGVRGTIYGCTDLAGYLGVEGGAPADEIRLLLANPRFDSHAAFRIDRALGLRNIASMTLMPPDEKNEPWLKAGYKDADGVIWNEIDFEYLLTDPRFQQVAA